VFSGGLINSKYNPVKYFFQNNNKLTNIPRLGAIPVGNYYMQEVTDNLKQRDFWNLGDRCVKGATGRCGFQLHPGTNSEGCITIDKDNAEAQSQYDNIKAILRQDEHNQIFVTP